MRFIIYVASARSKKIYSTLFAVFVVTRAGELWNAAEATRMRASTAALQDPYLLLGNRVFVQQRKTR